MDWANYFAILQWYWWKEGSTACRVRIPAPPPAAHNARDRHSVYIARPDHPMSNQTLSLYFISARQLGFSLGSSIYFSTTANPTNAALTFLYIPNISYNASVSRALILTK